MYCQSSLPVCHHTLSLAVRGNTCCDKGWRKMLDISERSIHLRLGQEPRDEQHQGKSFGESFLFYYSPYSLLGASQVALVVKKKIFLPIQEIQEIWVQSLGQKMASLGVGNGNPLQYSRLDNPMDRGAWWLQSMESQRVGHDWAAKHYSLLWFEVLQNGSR